MGLGESQRLFSSSSRDPFGFGGVFGGGGLCLRMRCVWWLEARTPDRVLDLGLGPVLGITSHHVRHSDQGMSKSSPPPFAVNFNIDMEIEIRVSSGVAPSHRPHDLIPSSPLPALERS